MANLEKYKDAARKFEQANPGVTVKMTWYQKEALNAALTPQGASRQPDALIA